MTRLEEAASAMLAAIDRGECDATQIELLALAQIVAATGNNALTRALIRAAHGEGVVKRGQPS